MKYNTDELINALDWYIAEQTANGKDWRNAIIKNKRK